MPRTGFVALFISSYTFNHWVTIRSNARFWIILRQTISTHKRATMLPRHVRKRAPLSSGATWLSCDYVTIGMSSRWNTAAISSCTALNTSIVLANAVAWGAARRGTLPNHAAPQSAQTASFASRRFDPPISTLTYLKETSGPRQKMHRSERKQHDSCLRLIFKVVSDSITIYPILAS